LFLLQVKKIILLNSIGFGILDVDMTNNGRTLTGKFYASNNNNGMIIDQFIITKPSRTTNITTALIIKLF
jgi:hypothetical protein